MKHLCFSLPQVSHGSLFLLLFVALGLACLAGASQPAYQRESPVALHRFSSEVAAERRQLVRAEFLAEPVSVNHNGKLVASVADSGAVQMVELADSLAQVTGFPTSADIGNDGIAIVDLSKQAVELDEDPNEYVAPTLQQDKVNLPENPLTVPDEIELLPTRHAKSIGVGYRTEDASAGYKLPVNAPTASPRHTKLKEPFGPFWNEFAGGIPGPQGARGAAGPDRIDRNPYDIPGAVGPPGPPGPAGHAGQVGPSGLDGPRGKKGSIGSEGKEEQQELEREPENKTKLHKPLPILQPATGGKDDEIEVEPIEFK